MAQDSSAAAQDLITVDDLLMTLTSAPDSRIESLMKQVIDARPQVADKLRKHIATSVNKSKKAPAIVSVLKVDWDENKAGDQAMIRDDRGGWLNIDEAKQYKVVGEDYRGLPIVHRGRGRINMKIVKQLGLKPGESAAEAIHKSDTLAVNTVTEYNAEIPRVSRRLAKKKDAVAAESDYTVLSDSSGDEAATKTFSGVVKIQQIVSSKRKTDQVVNCSQCNFIAPTKDEVWQHALENHRESAADAAVEVSTEDAAVELLSEDAKCEVCSQVLSSASVLHLHRSIFHTQNRANTSSKERPNIHRCKGCQQEFRSAIALRRHLNATLCCNDVPRQCIMCQSEFASLSDLIMHESGGCIQLLPGNQTSETALPERQDCEVSDEDKRAWLAERVHCSLCEVRQGTVASLLEHAKTAHPGEAPIKCAVCSSGYYDIRPLYNHHRSTHKELVCLSCEYCGKCYTTRVGLRQHIMSIHKGTRKGIQCPLCDKVLMHKKSLELHINGVHQNMRPFACEICDKRFTQKGNLDNHMLLHRGVRDQVCDVCGARFVQKSRLADHLKAHRGIRTHKCDTCKRMFSSAKDLRTHNRTHTGERPYECQVCHQRFAQSQTLNKHKKLHEPTVAHHCQFCNKTFRIASAIYRHYRARHRNRMTEFCSACGLSFINKTDLNRHFHYKHLELYDGTAEETTFAQAAAQQQKKDEQSIQSNELTRLQCSCRRQFNNLKDLISHSNSDHPSQELVVTMLSGFQPSVAVRTEEVITTEETSSTEESMTSTTLGGGEKVYDELATAAMGLVEIQEQPQHYTMEEEVVLFDQEVVTTEPLQDAANTDCNS